MNTCYISITCSGKVKGQEVFRDRVSFELELSKAIPKVQKELNRPGEGRLLRISKDPQEATCLEQRRSGRNDT